MKRIKNTFWKVHDHDNSVRAILEGTRFKRGKRQAIKLLYDKETVRAHPELYHQIDPKKADVYADYLCEIVKSKTWGHGIPRHELRWCPNKASSKGKWRDLYIPNLDNHTIQHMVMQANEKAFTRGMHPYCCGSVPGRGIKYEFDTIKRWLKNDKQLRYFVKLDIRKFFDNIDRMKLKEIIRAKIKDNDSLWIFDQIIDSAPVACPIGYYTSPWFANLYLEKMDWYIEQQLYKIRRGKRIKWVTHYLRYIDDMLLLGTSKSDLYHAVKAIISYLKNNYGIDIKPTWEIKAIGKHDPDTHKLVKGTYWLDMGGYKFCKDSAILRDGIFLSTKRLAKTMYKQGYYKSHQCASIISRVGWAKYCDKRTLMDRYIRPYVHLKKARRVIGDVAKIQQLRLCQAS